jgi:hypothetical protein
MLEPNEEPSPSGNRPAGELVLELYAELLQPSSVALGRSARLASSGRTSCTR